jgi:hypothetical protein
MADLSPSAQAVFDAAFKAYWNWDEDVPANSHTIAAAALRAAVVQTIPLTKTPWGSTLTPMLAVMEIHDKLLAIVAELEAQ